MTGEITLTGRVLPIGGLKEKILAAHRGKMKTIIIPKENEKDLKEIPANILKDLKIIPVEHTDEVLKRALTLTDMSKLFNLEKHQEKVLADLIYPKPEELKKVEIPPPNVTPTAPPTDLLPH